jgi:hypothetical protein
MAMIVGEPLAFGMRIKTRIASHQYARLVGLNGADWAREIQGQIRHSKVVTLSARS